MKLINLNRLKIALKNRIHHIVFIISLLSLFLLVAWWSLFIYRSIEYRYVAEKATLHTELENISLKYQLTGEPELFKKKIKDDDRFEIVDSEKSGSFKVRFHSPDITLFVGVTKNVVENMKKDLKRKKLMVFGESGLIILIIVISIIFLFKFIHLEKRSMRELEELWGRISHEIKTPIAGVKAFLESLENGSIGKDQIRKFTKLALKEVDKQEQLAENILTGSSFKNNLSLNIEDFDLIDFLNIYLREHSFVFVNGDIKFHNEGHNSLPVKADKHALKVIIDNIIDNSVKYASPDLLLEIKVKKSGKFVRIQIRDNGPGFDREDCENIFSAFKHMKEELPDTDHGTGMGLFISRKLARRMGGELEATGEGKGVGATFELEIPSR